MGHVFSLSGTNEFDQIERTFDLLGSPNTKIWPQVMKMPHVASGLLALRPDKYPYNNLHARLPSLTPSALDLLNGLLAYDPTKRLTARAAECHGYFTSDKPYPKEASMMPTFPTQHEALAPSSSSSSSTAGVFGHHQLLREDIFGPNGNRRLPIGVVQSTTNNTGNQTNKRPRF